jgi:single-stranded DNA-specific DHH superfamily exonuclease
MDGLNLRRKDIQEKMLEVANQQIDHDQMIMIASDTDFHEGIVGIVA